MTLTVVPKLLLQNITGTNDTDYQVVPSGTTDDSDEEEDVNDVQKEKEEPKPEPDTRREQKETNGSDVEQEEAYLDDDSAEKDAEYGEYGEGLPSSWSSRPVRQSPNQNKRARHDRRILMRREYLLAHSPTKRILELIAAFMVGFLCASLLFRHPQEKGTTMTPTPTPTAPTKDTNAVVSPPLGTVFDDDSTVEKEEEEDDDNPTNNTDDDDNTMDDDSLEEGDDDDNTPTSTTASVADDGIVSSSSTDDFSVLSLEERQAFATAYDDNNMTYFREPKSTPSGWWPTADWIQQCVTTPRNLTPFATLPEWEGYRLGDCVKICAGCPIERKPHAKEDLYQSPQLAHVTIAGEYWDRDCARGKQYHMKRGNESLLDEIIDSRLGQPGFYYPDPNAIVIHLRLGDKLEDADADVFEMLQNSAEPGRGSFRGYHAVKSLYEFLTNVVISGATKVSIHGGSQIPDMYQKSKTYAYCLQEAFVQAGYDSELNMEEGNADYDFVYMVNAKKVITTIGGFSRFIGHMVLRRGGIVYGRVYR
jgi:hypothetical protein